MVTYERPSHMKKEKLLQFLITPMLIFLITGCVENRATLRMIHGSFINIDTISRGPDIPMYSENLYWEGFAWRGERISSQLLFWSPEELKDVSIYVSDLLGPDHRVIPSEYLDLFQIQYVMSDEFADGCDKTGIIPYDSTLVADVLSPIESSLHIDANTPGLLWYSANIPHNTLPGIYKGNIAIGREKGGVKFELKIHVMPPELPPPNQWAFHLDLWQNPYAEARYWEVEPWTSEHFDLMRPTLEMLADAGQKCVTTTITDLPWGGQTFDPYQSMITKTRRTDGSWDYDYKIFDAWVEFAMECGISEQINCYSMVSWSQKYSYFDEFSGKDTSVQCHPGSREYNEIWEPFLIDFQQHLNEKGWSDITTISMDERSLEDLKEVLQLVRKVSPGLKIAFAGHYHPELDDELYDLSVASQHVIPVEALAHRRDSGFKSTFYVCCVEERPNTFSFSNPAEATYLSWYAAFRQFDGMLRWSYNSWTPDPFNDSRFRRFPAGDTYIVYPGGTSSVRFERLREGIQDYEKIKILRNTLSQENSEQAKEKLLLLDDLLATYTLENLQVFEASELIHQGKTFINKLSPSRDWPTL